MKKVTMIALTLLTLAACVGEAPRRTVQLNTNGDVILTNNPQGTDRVICERGPIRSNYTINYATSWPNHMSQAEADEICHTSIR